jgi:hypothetical protein
MATADNLSGPQFGSTLAGYGFEHRMTDAAHPHHHLDITHEGQSVGWLRWASNDPGEHFQPGEISSLRVEHGHRRQGVASAAFQHAQGYDPPPVHSPRRTAAGDAWARAHGAGPAEKIIPDAD